MKSICRFLGFGTTIISYRTCFHVKRISSCYSSLKAALTKQIAVQCEQPDDLESLGRTLSDYLDIGDVVLLKGDLAAGKTTLSRGIVRQKLQDDDLLVTSPTYLLDNIYTYEADRVVHHLDLYRMSSDCDFSFLGIPDIYETSICLIEWPQRIINPKFFPRCYLNVDIRINENAARIVTMTANGLKWENKLGMLHQCLNDSK
jgi:tRNA threonylcarbamoyladenosine biosynthesis protein TsaE